MQTTKRLALLTILTAVGLTASACVGGSSGKSQSTAAAGAAPKGTIEVVSFYPAGSSDYKRLQADAAAFEAKYPGTSVKLVFGGGQDTPKIQARWRSGNPPEVNYGFFDGTTKGMLKYADAGQVQSLNDWMSQSLDGYGSTWSQALLPSVKPFITEGVNTYAVPESISTIQIYYNKKIFADHGVTVPKTLADLETAAAKLKGAGVAPFAVTGTFNGYMQLWFDYLLLRHVGAKPVEAAIAGTRGFASLPGVSAAASDLEQLVKSGDFINGFQGTDFTAAQLNFFQGKAAMILMGSWLPNEMKDSIPSGFELGSFPFPTVDGASGDQSAIFGTTNNQVVAAQSKNPSTGVAWLQYLASKSVQTQFVQDTGQISAYRGVPAPAGLQDVVDNLDRPDAFVPSYFGVFGAGQQVMDAYQKPIAELFFGKVSATKMVAEIDSNLRAANGG